MTGDADGLLRAAFQHHQAGELQQAEALYRQVLDLQPDHADALHLRGLILQQVERHDEAVALIGRAADLAPEAAFYRVNLANSLIALGRAAEAADTLRAALAVDPDLADAHYNLGNLLTELGDPAGAADAFAHAAGLQPGWAEAQYGLGLALVATGRGAAGAEALVRAAAIRPDWAEPRAALGAVAADRRAWREAEGHYRDALERDPNLVTALVGLADARVKQHDWEEARACYLRAVEVAPDDMAAKVQLGQLLVKLGTFLHHYYRYPEGDAALDEAQALFDQALAADPDDVPALAGLANLHMERGDWEEAEVACLRALAMEAEFEPARHTLSQTYLYLGRLDQAEDVGHALLRDARDPGSMACVATRHVLPHVARWRGALDGLIRYGDGLPDADGDLPDAASLRAVGTAPLAVLADHDFRLDATFADLPADGRRHLLLADQPATRGARAAPGGGFGYQVTWEAAGHPALSLGDGTAWTILDHAALGGGPGGGRGFHLRLTRRGGLLAAEVDGETVLRVPLDFDHAIPGDTLRVGEGPCAPRRLRLYIDAAARPGPAGRQRVELLTVFYGDMFSRMLCDTLFPSLMLPGNLPALMAEREVVQNIYCTSRELPLIRRHLRALDRAGIGHMVDTAILDAGGDWVRNRIYLAVVDQIERALDTGAVIVMAPPDHIFGRGLARTVGAMGPGDYLLAGHPRVDMDAAYVHFRDLFRDPAATAALDNAALVDFAMHRHPHHVVTTGLANPDEPWWNARRDGDTYKARFKEAPPLAFQPSRDLIGVITGAPYAPPFETIDHDIVDLMQRTGRLKWIDDSRDFFWIEYCKMSRNVPTIRNTYWSPAARLLSEAELTWHL
ncbi:MAG: tetratricopeptide repeat protein [Hyphomicrobiales bacterium]|nr:tetratricopeptide repeat protein [Hyphomicrobiales bacterium]MCP5373646.1 tetratricopeptide repeat protein [Hyphomicrobiales bacterium]